MISVSGLASIGSLGLRFLAGSIGGHRLVTWAHAVDLPDPWRWVAAGNLVMTTGAGMPSDPREQVVWLERLADTNASALVIAPGDGAPVVSDDMLEAADRRMFPVLGAAFELEFVKLSRRVIESVLQAQRARFDAGEQLFQSYVIALREEPEMGGRLARLGAGLGVHLEIQDGGSGIPLASPPVPAMTDAVVERLRFSGRAKASLVISRPKDAAPRDPMLIHALVGLLGIELERIMIARDAKRLDGAVLLRSLLAGETEIATVQPMLDRRGLAGGLVCLAVEAGRAGAWGIDEIHHAPEFRGMEPLLHVADVLVAIMPDRMQLIEALRSNLGEGTRIGVSNPITAATGVRESYRQAMLALHHACDGDGEAKRYGSIEFNPTTGLRSLADARALVGKYLDPLMEHDRINGSSLLKTLAAFLDKDGNWKATAAALGIHRQTLVYRLRQIERISRLKPTSTLGTARFWSALEAGRVAGLL